MILKLRDDSPHEEGWLYVDNVHSTKVEYTTFAFTKDHQKEDDGGPRYVHDENKDERYRLGIHSTIEEDQKRDSGGSTKTWVPNRGVEFHGGKMLCDWRSLIKDYEVDSDEHIGIKMITAIFDTKDGKESETYIVQKGQEVYLLSDTGKTIERI